jgi:hypothetical protein
MQTTIPKKNLRHSIAEIFTDAITYFKLRAEDAAENRDMLLATMAVKEFTTGRDMLHMLIDQDGETFLVPEAADTVTQSLLNFHAALDGKKFPLLWWRVTDVVIQSQTAPCLCESEDDLGPKQTLH